MKEIESGTTDSEKHTPQGTPKTRDSGSENPAIAARKLTANALQKTKLSKGISTHSLRTVSTCSGTSSLMTPPRTRKKPYGTITINVGTMTGKVFELDVFPTETVGQIKERISFEEGIPTETQILVYCGQHLKNDFAVIKTLGIQDGSNLSLVIQMNVGPGPPSIPTPPTEDEQVVFLLCKQNQELFVLEVHLKDGQRPRTVMKHLLRLQSPLQGNELLERLESNECFDISDICELQLKTPKSRPQSGDSIHSFISYNESIDSQDNTTPKYENEDEPFIDQLFWESEWLLSGTTPPVVKPRPATSISIMRLPSGTKPMVIIPKTRPATAEKIIEGVKRQIDGPPMPKPTQTLKSEKESSILTEKKISQDNGYDLEWETLPEKQRPQSRFSKATRPPTSKPKVLATQIDSNSTETLMQFTSKTAASSRKSSPRKTSARRKTPGKPVPTKRSVCHQCNKKLGPAQVFMCKCKKMYCSAHRYSDRHGCSFDYKSVGKKELEKNNPLVKNDKCIKL